MVDGEPEKVYVGATEHSCKERFYNCKTLFNNSMKVAQHWINIYGYKTENSPVVEWKIYKNSTAPKTTSKSCGLGLQE